MVTIARSFIALIALLLSLLSSTAHLWLPIAIALIALQISLRRHFLQRWGSQLKRWVGLHWKKFVRSLLLIYACLLCLLWLLQPRLLYHPSRAIQNTPASYSVDYEELWIPTDAAVQHPEHLHSWWMPHPHNPIGTLIYLHGADLNISFNVTQAFWLRQLGFSVLLADYRGYGQSEGGFPSETSLYKDAESALAYLTQQQGIAADQIFVYGHSLGGAIAIHLATHHPELAGLIIQNSFTSMADMVTRFPYTQWLPLTWILNQRFESLQKVENLHVPTLFIHATGDPLIPAAMGEKLYEVARSFKELLLVELNVHHNAASEYKDSRYLVKIQMFALKALLAAHQ